MEADSVAVSPDGSLVVFSLENESGQSALWLRRRDSVEPRLLPGTEGGIDPFWSPDGKHIGFFADNQLKRIAVEGGPAQRIADADRYSGAWNRDGVILFTPSFGKPLVRVSASGGTPEPETELDPKAREIAHYFPRFLPDGKRYLFMVRNVDPAKTGIWLGTIGSKERRLLLLADSGPIYVDPGYLLFSRAGALFAQAFNPSSGALSGEPVPLAERIGVDLGSNRLQASAGPGIAVYRVRSGINRTLGWFERDGRPAGNVGQPGGYRGLALSPDGKRVAYALMDSNLGTTDLWIRDLSRGTATRLTTDPTDEFNPTWSPDGEMLYYTSDREGLYHVYRKAPSGSGEDVLVLRNNLDKWVSSVSPDGSALLYTSFSDALSFDIWRLPLPSGEPEPFRNGRFLEGMARFSPDGRSIVYEAGGSGRVEVFVAGRSPGTKTIQVSTEGGGAPQWSRDGRELFYRSLEGKIMAASVREVGGTLEVGTPRVLFEAPFASRVGDERSEYAVAPDGRFLLTVDAEKRSADPVVAILDWEAALRK
jgi:Tol biopolymer transport system component